MMFNHFQLQDGVCRSAIAIANLLVERDDVDVTLIPLFKYDKEALMYISGKVQVKPVFRTYYKGMSNLVQKIPARWLYKMIVGDKYDVNIAFQYGTSQVIISAGNDNKKLSIGWMHGYDNGMVMKPYYLKLDKMVCVSKCNAIRLQKDLDGTIPVDYNYNPIDDEYVREQGNQQNQSDKPNNFLFATVGRLSPEKGYVRLLNCVSRLKQEGFLFTLWIIGDGPMMNDLQDQARALSLDDYVIFWGRQNNPHSYTAKADVFICSSLSEGYSTACQEAIMLNVPVISTNVSGAEEIISDAGCGEVFESTEDAIYTGMKKVLDNPLIVAEWKEKLKTTKYKFSPAKRFERFLNIVGITE